MLNEIEQSYSLPAGTGTTGGKTGTTGGKTGTITRTENQQQEADNGIRIETARYDNGTPESAGNTGDDRAPGDDAGDKEKTDSVRESDEGSGAPAGGGREADHGGMTGADPEGNGKIIVTESVNEIWQDLLEYSALIGSFVENYYKTEPENIPPTHLDASYRNAVNVAADLEKFMIVRDQRYGEINHAQ